MSNYDRYRYYTESQYEKKGLSYYFMKKQADKRLLPYVTHIRKKRVLEVGPGYGYSCKWVGY